MTTKHTAARRPWDQQAYEARVSACLKACEGIDNDALLNAQSKQGEQFTAFGKACAERDFMRSRITQLVAALEDAEFLMRQAGKIPGPMQDSFRRSAEDARAAIAKATGE